MFNIGFNLYIFFSYEKNLERLKGDINQIIRSSLEQMKVPLHAINSDMQATEIDIFKKYVPEFEAKIVTDVGIFYFGINQENFKRYWKRAYKNLQRIKLNYFWLGHFSALTEIQGLQQQIITSLSNYR